MGRSTLIDMSEEQALAPQPRRRRDAAVTRAAILRSAIAAFTRAGYDGIGVREIAHDAGVTAMLVNRYFGSKEGLFAEAVDTAFARPTVVNAESGDLGRSIAEQLVVLTGPDADHLDPFLLMLRSAGSPRAAEIIRDAVERHVGARLTGLLHGDDRAERAETALGLIAGLWLLRKVIGTTALRDADEERLTRRVAAMLRVLTGED